ncbi:YHS domain-containing (seleno)protein [Aestuariibius sp. HNIBRBA575]|uniref:YHS domain-containing (seleno)protein n=1 Tax=Aestuariibius sp. HNIBRBA575 TaxID=3233343 RepID=UPI0034A2BAFF
MLSRRQLLKTSLVLAPIVALPQIALAGEPETFAVDGIAIRGADPVAFFTQGGPVMGDAAHSYDWAGATWHFANAENRDMFAADPTAYAPQFGGYCAFAASKGALATSVPEAWTIYEGKLYLNFSVAVRQVWSEDIPGNIALAEANWPGILG